MIYFLGDTHGEWEVISSVLKKLEPGDTLIHVGDVGVGFPAWKQGFDRVKKACVSRDIELLAIRGNHDDPALFTIVPGDWEAGFHLVQDYSIAERHDHVIGFVGGAVSIDRSGRKAGTSWWPGEGVVSGELPPCDLLVSHLSPTEAPPQGAWPPIVIGWLRRDPALRTELPAEREIMQQVVRQCGASCNIFGHFHQPFDTVTGKVRYRGLDINEVVSLGEILFVN